MKVIYCFLVIVATCLLPSFCFEFEQSSYEILEDIGLDNRALRVCVSSDEDANVIIATTAGSATGNTIILA